MFHNATNDVSASAMLTQYFRWISPNYATGDSGVNLGIGGRLDIYKIIKNYKYTVNWLEINCQMNDFIVL